MPSHGLVVTSFSTTDESKVARHAVLRSSSTTKTEHSTCKLRSPYTPISGCSFSGICHGPEETSLELCPGRKGPDLLPQPGKNPSSKRAKQSEIPLRTTAQIWARVARHKRIFRNPASIPSGADLTRSRDCLYDLLGNVMAALVFLTDQPIRKSHLWGKRNAAQFVENPCDRFRGKYGYHIMI